ncbi:MAG: hypothetical protein M0Z49_04125 [Chloroflexi bacterium]|nr:hypothetical protein [Chloroflexota bacterium]
MGDPIGTVLDLAASGVAWLHAQAYGFGLLVLPLGALGIISLLVARRR